MQYKNIFFDLDRTLWDYDANSSGALTDIYQDYGLSDHFSSPEEFIQIYNLHNDILWENYRNGTISKSDLRSKRFNLALMEKKVDDPGLSITLGERYMQITPKMNILTPNTPESLEYLRNSGYNLYILTNGFIATQEKKLANSRISHYFKRIYSSEEIGINKPKKEIFHWAVSSLNAHKKDCLMVGDDVEVDVKGALDYGIDAIWYNPGNLKSEIIPTATIEDLEELMKLL